MMSTSRQQHVSWRDRSESVEQLDKLLAGLDELSGNLPDLAAARNGKKRPPPAAAVTSSPPPAVRQDTSYEDDVDYALDRSELGQEDRSDRVQVKVGLQPAVAVDNYSEYYTDWSKSRGGDRMDTQPYHTRYDSKPFSYIRSNSSLSRPSSRNGLESPSLLRRVILPPDDSRATPPPPPLSPSPSSRSSSATTNNNNGYKESSPFLSVVNSASSVMENSFGQINSDSLSWQQTGQQNNSQRQQNNSQRQQQNNSVSSQNGVQNGSDSGLTWLQKQQHKLEERRRQQSQQGRDSSFLMKELKTSLQRTRSGCTETTDGYASDVNSLGVYSETSRESSPAKQLPVYHVPVQLDSTTSDDRTGQDRTATRSSDIRTGQDTYSSVNRTVHDNTSAQNTYSSVNKTMQDNTSAQNTYSSVNKCHTLPSHPQYNNTQYNNSQYNNTQYNNTQYNNTQNRSASATRAYDRSQPPVSRQVSDSSFDRGRARRRAESECDLGSAQESLLGRNVFGSATSVDFPPGSRPITPAFPFSSSTATLPPPSAAPHHGASTTLPPKSPGGGGVLSGPRSGSLRAPSPAGSMYQAGDAGLSRRGSFSSEPADVSATAVRLVKERYRFWYKPAISREEAIALLGAAPPGSFVVRDSNSFPGAFGLALKVATPPANAGHGGSGNSGNSELVRHFLIEPTSKGVKLKGYSNEPVFASLSALVYQHTITAMALPTSLVLPHEDLDTGSHSDNNSQQMQNLLQLGAACNVHYLFTMETDQLTGPQAVRKTVSQLFLTRPLPGPTVVHFKVSGQGITLTDQARKIFFRKHYNVGTISHCGLDPEDRRWSVKSQEPGLPAASNRLFGFVAVRPSSRSNQCHLFAELDPDQPARAIVNFVNKLMLSGSSGAARSDIV